MVSFGAKKGGRRNSYSNPNRCIWGHSRDENSLVCSASPASGCLSCDCASSVFWWGALNARSLSETASSPGATLWGSVEFHMVKERSRREEYQNSQKQHPGPRVARHKVQREGAVSEWWRKVKNVPFSCVCFIILCIASAQFGCVY